jgi:hypothetical protein
VFTGFFNFYKFFENFFKNRPGVRFHSRGADSAGNCSNFVETEQLVEFDVGRKSSNSSKNEPISRHIASFVQVFLP